MKKVEFLYFEGCPSYKEAIKNLEEVLNEEKIESNIEMTNIDSPEKAQQLGFLGSPSIRINGKDLEGERKEFSYSCRIYNISGNQTGIPTKEFIRNKILKLN